MIIVVFVVAAMNFQTSIVRAEGFGERSLMYGLVAQDAAEIVQEYAIEDAAITVSTVSYRKPLGVTAETVQFEAVFEAQPGVGIDYLGGALTAIEEAGAEAPVSARKRTEVEVYTVASGDTLSSIASRYGLSINTLLWANNLSVNSVLRPGDTLSILPVDGVKHTVKSGDTIAQISYDYDVDQTVILEYNNMGGSSILSIGDELIIPGGEKRATTRSTSSAISSLFTAPTTPSPSTPSVTSTQASSGGYMVWPTDLRVITQYYSWRHNGLDVDCYYDNYNYSSDDGYVTYSGWNGNYGYLVEVDHGNGIVTRYAHNAALYVSVGQYVTAGQAVGLCGTTGYSSGTHLHYEVIVNGVRRNPLEYIR